MPRKQRQEDSGLIHHASARGVDDEFIFRSDEDRIAYLLMLAATVARYRWLCLSYCLMGTHAHLLVETREPNFGDGMRWFHGHYGRCFNKHHGRRGPLFGGRYHDEPVLRDEHLVMVVGYIAMNPVDAGLCRTPEAWAWSSHRAAVMGPTRRWMAHDRLEDRLEAISGSRGAYKRIVAARAAY